MGSAKPSRARQQDVSGIAPADLEMKMEYVAKARALKGAWHTRVAEGQGVKSLIRRARQHVSAHHAGFLVQLGLRNLRKCLPRHRRPGRAVPTNRLHPPLGPARDRSADAHGALQNLLVTIRRRGAGIRWQLCSMCSMIFLRYSALEIICGWPCLSVTCSSPGISV